MNIKLHNLMKNKLLFCLISALVISILLSGLFLSGFMKTQSDALSDKLYSESKAFGDIVIVAIDDKSIQAIGRWPWSRSVFAEALDKFKDARAIGIDVSFLEPENNVSDSLLQKKLDELKGKVVLVSECSQFSNGKCTKWMSPIFDVETAAANVFEESGITRAVPSEVDNLESFSRRLAQKYLNTQLNLSSKNYMRFSKFDEISFSDIANSSEDLTQDFKGKIVLIGATAKDLQDFKETPVGKVSGVEVHASAVQSAITNSFLKRQSNASVMVWIFLLSIFTSMLLWKLKLPLASVFSGLLIIAYLVIAIFEFDSGMVYNLIYPVLGVALTYFAIIGVYYLIEARQRKWISNVLGKYVSDSVAKEIMEKGEDALKLKGEKKVVTVLFADVRGFTSMSEKLQPEQVVEVLNRYLSKMTDIVFKHEGTLDKYVGDEIMATYNVPLNLKDHALKAVQTAIEMQKVARGMGEELKYGIGINTGDAIVGNIGSAKRLDYTVIGDSVNLGARLCGKAEPNQILISESTYHLVKDKIETKSIGEITVKGKEKPLRVYEIVY